MDYAIRGIMENMHDETLFIRSIWDTVYSRIVSLLGIDNSRIFMYLIVGLVSLIQLKVYRSTGEKQFCMWSDQRNPATQIAWPFFPSLDLDNWR